MSTTKRNGLGFYTNQELAGTHQTYAVALITIGFIIDEKGGDSDVVNAIEALRAGIKDEEELRSALFCLGLVSGGYIEESPVPISTRTKAVVQRAATEVKQEFGTDLNFSDYAKVGEFLEKAKIVRNAQKEITENEEV